MKRYIYRAFASVACVAFMGLLCVLGASASTTEYGGAFTINNAYIFAWATDAQAELSNKMQPATERYEPFAITAIGVADQYQYFVYTCVDGNGTPATGDLSVGGWIGTATAIPKFRYDYNDSQGMNNRVMVGIADVSLREGEQVIMYRDPLGSWVHNNNALTSGYLMDNTADQPVQAIFSAWRDALLGFQGIWNGETISERIETARQSGFSEGVQAGKAEGYETAKTQFDATFSEAIRKARLQGWNEAMDQYRETGSTSFWIDIPAIIDSYIFSAGELVNGFLDFDLFGINIAGVFGAIIATLVLAFVVGLLLKLFGLLI